MVYDRNAVSKKVRKLRFPQNHGKALVKQRFQHSAPQSVGRGTPWRTHGNHRGSLEIIGFSTAHAAWTQVGPGTGGARPWGNYGFPETAEIYWKINV